MNITIDSNVKSNNICEKVTGVRSAFVRRVLDRHNDGLSIKQLAEEFGMSEATVYVSLNRAEEETGTKRQARPSGKRMTQDQLDMIVDLMGKGWSIRRTAQKVGVYDNAIISRIKSGTLLASQHQSPVFQHKEQLISALEERINRMERMAKHGIY
jgi:transposase|nr:MAG TPA: transposase [Caudoviricetes sp.]